MKDLGTENADWGAFQLPEPGKYLVQYMSVKYPTEDADGNELNKIRFGMLIEDGENEDEIGQEYSFNLNLDKKKPVKQLYDVAKNCSKFWQGLNKKYPGELDITDPRVIDTMKISLPGNKCYQTIEIGEFNNFKFVRVRKVELLSTGKGESTQTKKPTGAFNQPTVEELPLPSVDDFDEDDF